MECLLNEDDRYDGNDEKNGNNATNATNTNTTSIEATVVDKRYVL